MNPFDVILLPGLRLQAGGQPQPEMRLRANKAYELWKLGLAPRIVACGGDAAGVGISEAAALKQILVEMGVPGEAVLTEDDYYITAENFRNAARLVGKGARAALCTSDYHMPRAKLLCKKEGFRVKGLRRARPLALTN